MTLTFEIVEILIGRKAFSELFHQSNLRNFEKFGGEPPTSYLSPYLRVKSSKSSKNRKTYLRGGLKSELGVGLGGQEFFRCGGEPKDLL